jgi:hypothetical protein
VAHALLPGEPGCNKAAASRRTPHTLAWMSQARNYVGKKEAGREHAAKNRVRQASPHESESKLSHSKSLETDLYLR